MQTLARIQMPEGGLLNFWIPDVAGDLHVGQQCLCSLDYGIDYGKLVALFTIGPHEAKPAFNVVRASNEADTTQIAKQAERAQKAQHSFEQAIRFEKNPVKIVHVRFSFNGDRLFIRYGAQSPVDLRRFTGQIQRTYNTHVDLWQVGVRDEAAFVGCIGQCGRSACCCTWQRQFQNLTVKHARDQDIPLNPVTINGTCGRLKCCLAFEHKQYCEAARHLPEGGMHVCAQHNGDPVGGTIVGRDILRSRLTVRTDDGRYLTLPANAVKIDHSSHPRDKKGEPHENTDREWPES